MTLRSAVTAAATIVMLAACTDPDEGPAYRGNDAGHDRVTSSNDVQPGTSDHPDYSAWDRIEDADYQGFTWKPLLRYTDGTPTKTYLKLRADGTYSGSDGCNGQFRTYSLWPNGDLTADPGPQTMIGCLGININQALQVSDNVRIEGRRLTLYDGTRVVLVLTTVTPILACCP